MLYQQQAGCINQVFSIFYAHRNAIRKNSESPPLDGLGNLAISGVEGEACAFFVVHMHGAAGDKIASKDALCQRVFQIGLDGAF